MVRRDEFDDGLRLVAQAAGVQVRQRAAVRALTDRGDSVSVQLADGSIESARTVVGADGSSGVTARHVGVTYSQVDLGLEVELPVGPAERDRWRGRLLIDWGPLPGSYGWVFMTTRSRSCDRRQGQWARTKDYSAPSSARRVGRHRAAPRLGALTAAATNRHHRRGRVIVAGDAAGLLEPWTRRISFALRSGELAGAAAAAGDLDGYVAVTSRLAPTMTAGRRILVAFTRRLPEFHAPLRTPPAGAGSSVLPRRTAFESAPRHRTVRAALRLLS
jgi:flavin-dependent dehydrogenase